MNVAIIPARGGSKRIPRKNVLEFAGKPLIAHSIAAALDSGAFTQVVVSTDDAEIAAVAREYGATVPFMRSAELSDDYAGTTAVVADAVRRLGDAGITPEYVCCIYATAPLIQAADIAAGLELIRSGEWAYVFSATTFDFPIHRGFKDLGEDGVDMVFPEHQGTRSQDLPEVLHDAGQFYWGTRSVWLEQRPIFGRTSTVVRLPRWRVQDIDTPEDLERARILSQLVTG